MLSRRDSSKSTTGTSLGEADQSIEAPPFDPITQIASENDTDARLAALMATAVPGFERQLAHGESLREQGGSRAEIGLIKTGICQVHAAAKGGHRFVADFLFPGRVLYTAQYRAGTALEIGIEAIGECQIVLWSDGAFTGHCEGCAGVHIYEQLTSLALARINRRFVSFLTKTAGERFAELNSDFPPAWRQIPQHLIASYLAITPQYLSQLKRRASVAPG